MRPNVRFREQDYVDKQEPAPSQNFSSVVPAQLTIGHCVKQDTMTATKYLGLRGRALNHAMLGLVVFPAFTLFGYNQGVVGGLLNLPSWVAIFPSIDTVNTTGSQNVENARIQGTIVAIYTASGLFGALSCIWLGDRLGRKITIFIGAALALVGAVLQGSSYSLAQLIVGRVIAGLGVGGITAVSCLFSCGTTTHDC